MHSSINGVKMLILNLPAAEEAGWVTVEVHGSDETGKSSYLGQTTFFYFDEYEKVLELIIHNKEQQGWIQDFE